MGFVGAIAIALAMSGRGGDVAGPHIYYDEPIAPTLERGAEGVWVETLNERLLELGFHPDIGDEFGNKTRHAVFAFQKHHEMPTTGKFTPGMWHLLDEHVSLPWRPESARVEIDLGKQVLYVVESSEVTPRRSHFVRERGEVHVEQRHGGASLHARGSVHLPASHSRYSSVVPWLAVQPVLLPRRLRGSRLLQRPQSAGITRLRSRHELGHG